jgi:hypothetical protein
MVNMIGHQTHAKYFESIISGICNPQNKNYYTLLKDKEMES